MKFAGSLFLAVTVSGPALAAGQLPRTVVPVLYEIDIQPDAKSLTFAGTETVTVDVRQATRTMTLNAADLNLTTATFDGKPARVSTDAAAQTLTVTLPATATVGQHRLAFQWTGKINQSAAGLFAIDYINVDGSKARMLATQFEAPDARRFAPMWDEPSFKAKFRLSSTAPAGQTAYSNMPATSVTKRADGGQLYRFGETPVMSSYLLFLGMGDVERRTVTANGTEIGVIARRGVIDQGDYALGAAKRLLSYYNDYFGQRYPLPKMDMIAGPGSSQFFSAMENWGAIFYFEPTLLFDPSRTAESGRQSVHVTVAHEMAHQWFGDLVTMAWWDDLWLNEGFASWMEGKATADLNPSWKAGASAVAFERESAMAIDATSATHPIVRKVETVDQIGEAFDGITYMKGQAVIGMMESTLGADVFRDGIRRYMAKYKYGNTVTNQLWTELSAASGRDIGGIARDFTLQGGVPLVTMTGSQCVGGDTKISLRQGRFGLDMPSKQPQAWRVPLVVSTIGGGSANAVVTGAQPTSLTVKGCGTVVLNMGKGSYTRAMYDDAGHAAVVRDYGRLSLEDRLGTLGDDFALALGGYQPLDRYFAVQAQVGAGADPLEWSMVAAKLERLAGLLAGTPLEQRLQDRTRSLLTPVLGRIGFELKDGESPLVGNLRERLIEQLGSEGDASVTARARDYVSRMRNDPAALPGAIRQPILSTYAVNATPAEWDALLAMTKAERSPVTKNGYVRLLGASADEANARRALALLKTDALTDPQKASLLRAIAGAHADLAFDWALANQATVDGFIEQSSRTGFIVGLAGGSKDPAMPTKVASYANKYLPAGSRGPADRVIAQMRINREAGDRLQAATARWLAQQDKS